MFGFGRNGGFDFNDIFGQAQDNHNRRNRPMKGDDVIQQVNVTLEDTYYGVTKTIEINKYSECSACNGQGGEKTECGVCHGSGNITQRHGSMIFSQICNVCRGTGFLIKNQCKVCKGFGYIKTKENLTINIPKGITGGSKLRVPGNGYPGKFGGPYGDLYIAINIPKPEFLESLEALCHAHGTLLILDEIQSGCGRSGKFFAFQYSNITPDIVTMAKGIANGFPVGATLISPKFEAVKGQLGTTFGGNYLGMAAAIAVMDIIKDEKLVENAAEVGAYIMANLPKSDKIKSVKGYGLMIGIEFNEPMKEIRSKLLFEKHIFTGMAGTNMIRILPPLSLTKAEADEFLSAFKDVVS